MAIKMLATTTVVNNTMTTGAGTTTLTVIIGPVDIGHYEKYCVTIHNNYTAGGLIGLLAQVCNEPGDPGSPTWVNLPTTTFVLGSQIGPSAIIGTTAIENCYRWFRLIGGITATAGTGHVRAVFAGHGGT